VFEYYTLHILLSQSYFYTASAPMPKTEAGISDYKKIKHMKRENKKDKTQSNVFFHEQRDE
jgi:hypothetical protein